MRHYIESCLKWWGCLSSHVNSTRLVGAGSEVCKCYHHLIESSAMPYTMHSSPHAEIHQTPNSRLQPQALPHYATAITAQPRIPFHCSNKSETLDQSKHHYPNPPYSDSPDRHPPLHSPLLAARAAATSSGTSLLWALRPHCTSTDPPARRLRSREREGET